MVSIVIAFGKLNKQTIYLWFSIQLLLQTLCFLFFCFLFFFSKKNPPARSNDACVVGSIRNSFPLAFALLCLFRRWVHFWLCCSFWRFFCHLDSLFSYPFFFFFFCSLPHIFPVVLILVQFEGVFAKLDNIHVWLRRVSVGWGIFQHDNYDYHIFYLNLSLFPPPSPTFFFFVRLWLVLLQSSQHLAWRLAGASCSTTRTT